MCETTVVLSTLQGVVVVNFKKVNLPPTTNQRTGFGPIYINPFTIQGLSPNPVFNPLKPIAFFHGSFSFILPIKNQHHHHAKLDRFFIQRNLRKIFPRKVPTRFRQPMRNQENGIPRNSDLFVRLSRALESLPSIG